jgi:hypothetical protein
LFEHDLFGKPLHTFPDHALEQLQSVIRIHRRRGLRRLLRRNAERAQEVAVRARSRSMV